MATTKTVRKRKRMGYATIASVLYALEKHKEGQIEFPLTAQKLASLGVPQWNIFILYHTLVDLAFIRDGYPTEIFNRLAQTYQTDQIAFQAMLEDHIRDMYADALNRIPDLAHASQPQLIDAFRIYELPKQHHKMVALFKGLCREAGLPINEPEIVGTASANEQDSEIHTITLQETSTPDTLQPYTLQEVEGNPLMVEPPSNTQMNGSLPTPDYSEAEEIGKFLMSLFELPKKPGWTEEDRTWWRLAVSSKAEKIAQLTKEHGGMKP